MSDFGFYLYRAVEILATGEGNVKNRLGLALTELAFADVPGEPSIPDYFQEKIVQIRKELSTKTWGDGIEDDRVRTALHRMHYKTAAKYARRIWDLYEEFKECEHSGFIPEKK